MKNEKRANCPTLTHTSVLVICEGYEDTDYIIRLKECGVWDDNIDIATVNAKGLSKIPKKYEDSYKLHNYEAVVVFCDTEMEPFSQYEDVRSRIAKFRRNGAVDRKFPLDKIVFHVNPCTMQVVVMHFDYALLKTNDKSENTAIIKHLIKLKHAYDTKKEQHGSIMGYIDRENYEEMKRDVDKLVRSRTSSGMDSTNVLELFEILEGKAPNLQGEMVKA